MIHSCQHSCVTPLVSHLSFSPAHVMRLFQPRASLTFSLAHVMHMQVLQVHQLKHCQMTAAAAAAAAAKAQERKIEKGGP